MKQLLIIKQYIQYTDVGKCTIQQPSVLVANELDDAVDVMGRVEMGEYTQYHDNWMKKKARSDPNFEVI